MPLLRASGPLTRFPLFPWVPTRTIPGMALTQYRPGAFLQGGAAAPVTPSARRLLEDNDFRLLEDDDFRLLEGS